MMAAQARLSILFLQFFVSIYIVFTACIFIACSNSEPVGFDIEETTSIHCRDTNVIIYPPSIDPIKADSAESASSKVDSLNFGEKIALKDTSSDIDSFESHEIVCDTIKNQLFLDASMFPYAGIPRIVIETENHLEIKDRETEIPAKLQIWGEKDPESEVMNLTIRGRGNSTWKYPKQPYAIKFNKKQTFLGMPQAKKWVMLANYRDRTLIRNAVAFEIARQTNQEWVPQGRFVDVFLNKKPIGNYFVTEKIEINKNRLSLGKNSFLLEADARFDGDHKFKTTYKKLPINIKYPSAPSEQQIDYIAAYLDSAENALYQNKDDSFHKFIDIASFADFWIIHELAQNKEPYHPFSVHFYKRENEQIKAGPIWDFDWQTFSDYHKGLIIQYSVWNDAFLWKKEYRELVKQRWAIYKSNFEDIIHYIDSLAEYTKPSNEFNHQLWPIQITEGFAGDEQMSFEESILQMKHTYKERIVELDSIFNTL